MKYWYFDGKKWKEGTWFERCYALWKFHNELHDKWLKYIERLNLGSLPSEGGTNE